MKEVEIKNGGLADGVDPIKKLEYPNETEIHLVSLSSTAITSDVEYLTRKLVEVHYNQIVIPGADCVMPLPFCPANETIFPSPPQALMQDKLQKQQLLSNTVIVGRDCVTPLPLGPANETIYPSPPQALLQDKLQKQQLLSNTVIVGRDCVTPLPFCPANETIYPSPPQALMQDKLQKQQQLSNTVIVGTDRVSPLPFCGDNETVFPLLAVTTGSDAGQLQN